MAAAPDAGLLTELAIVSPELVLVDPELAAPARTHLADGLDSLLDESSTALEVLGPFRVRFPDDGDFSSDRAATAEARRRLTNSSVDSEVLASLRSPGRFRRRATLVPSSAAAISTFLLVLQLYLHQGKLG